MKQTLVAAAASRGQKNHKSFCMNPFLRCSKYVYFSFTDAIELWAVSWGENGATGYVCYYTIHPPTSAQWDIFTIFCATHKYGCLWQANFLTLLILKVLHIGAIWNDPFFRCSKYVYFSFADAIELWAMGGEMEPRDMSGTIPSIRPLAHSGKFLPFFIHYSQIWLPLTGTFFTPFNTWGFKHGSYLEWPLSQTLEIRLFLLH